MKIGETKVVEWVPLGKPLEADRRLAQAPVVLASHNHYSVLTERSAMKFYCFPVHTDGPKKGRPVHTGWQQSAELREPREGDGIYTGHPDAPLVVVDVDVKNGKDGWQAVTALELAGDELPDTLTQKTKSGGTHLIYRSHVALKQGANVLGAGLDVRSRGGYIVYYGPLTGEIAEVPGWLIQRLGVAKEASPAGAEPLPGVDLAEAVLRAEQYIETAEPAVQGAGGDEHTYRVVARIKDFGVPEHHVFDVMADWNERCAPPWSPTDLHQKIRNAYAYGTQPVGALSPTAEFGPQDLEQAQEPAHPILKFNADHAYVVTGGTDHILFETRNEYGMPRLDHLNIETFHRKHAAQRIMMGKKSVPLTQAWLEDPGRRGYDGLVFMPQGSPPDRFYNLWRGFSVEPLEHGVAPDPRWVKALDAWREHALKNVCGGSELLCHWLIGWFAHAIQRPGEKPLVALVFKGGKGVGKNALVGRVSHLLGGHALNVANKRYLTGNFNGHLEACLMLTLDEAFWSGDKSMDGILKDLITGSEHLIEHKGKEAFTVRNLTRVVIIGNEDWLVPASTDERRYAVFEVGEGRKQDTAFFEEMRLGMEAGGYRLLLRWLSEYDIRGLNFREAPTTQALLDQKTQSLDLVSMWWFDSLTEGRLADFEGEAWPTTPLSGPMVRRAIHDYAKRKGRGRFTATDHEITRQLRKLTGIPAPRVARPGNGAPPVRCYEFRGLTESRAAWDQHIGHAGKWE